MLRVFDVSKLWSLWLSCKIGPFVNYRRFSQSCRDFSPENEKKMLSIWIDLGNFKVLFLRNSRGLIVVCSLNVLKNIFIMLLS